MICEQPKKWKQYDILRQTTQLQAPQVWRTHQNCGWVVKQVFHLCMFVWTFLFLQHKGGLFEYRQAAVFKL